MNQPRLRHSLKVSGAPTAFTLYEILVVLALLVTAMALAVPITRWSVVTLRQANEIASDIPQMEQAIRTLRRDVWQAGAVTVKSPNELELRSDTDPNSKAPPIIWHIEADQTLRRVATDHNNVWRTGNQPMKFVAADAGLILGFGETKFEPGGSIALISQMILAKGEEQ